MLIIICIYILLLFIKIYTFTNFLHNCNAIYGLMKKYKLLSQIKKIIKLPC